LNNELPGSSPQSQENSDDRYEILKLKEQKLHLLQEKLRLKEGLPHLYGWPWYKWAYDFFTCTDKMALLTAANQISKSSTQIRTCIDWATNPEKWSMWRTKPNQFWYLYPTKDVATIEFYNKWVTEFMPRGEFKDSPQYGWKVHKKGKEVHHVEFNSGINLYFKAYAQDVQHLQSSSPHAMFCDEELPEDIYSEIMIRLAATDGFFRMVFTATLGQEFWREAMEMTGENERFPWAWKRQVSMYDCLHYKDGTASPWTIERIKHQEALCKSDKEIQRRIYGRFVKDEGLKYQGYDATKNYKPGGVLPKDWLIYTGVDLGSGGSSGHPAAIVFVAVRPDFRAARVIKGWRGDGIPTTNGDVLEQYRSMRGEMKPVLQQYDPSSKDFGLLAANAGEPFVPAERSHEIGEGILNAVFKNDMMSIDSEDPQMNKLSIELGALLENTNKRRAKDDFIDALRYAVGRVPWDLSDHLGDYGAKPKQKREPTELDERRWGLFPEKNERSEFDEEFDEWNDAYG